MDLTVKIGKLDRPNLNNVVYSKECIQNVEKQILGNIIPVKLITNDFWNQTVAPVGSAQLDTALYPELHFSVNICDPEVKKSIYELQMQILNEYAPKLIVDRSTIKRLVFQLCEEK